jgi:hypothetical protein
MNSVTAKPARRAVKRILGLFFLLGGFHAKADVMAGQHERPEPCCCRADETNPPDAL